MKKYDFQVTWEQKLGAMCQWASQASLLWISSEWNDNPKKSLGLQTKPKKIPGPIFNTQKIPCKISKL